MAYNQFKKLEQLHKKLGVLDQLDNWLLDNYEKVDFEVTDRLRHDLQEASQEALTTEKAKSEYIIVPVLKELKRHNPTSFSTFSGFEFNVDAEKGLRGYCNFILSARTKRAEITAPVFCLVEAKDGELKKGYAQCGAEMVAAQLYNEREGLPQKVVYGCVTNAFSWCFLKLEGKTLSIDPNYVPLTFQRPEPVLRALQWILHQI